MRADPDRARRPSTPRITTTTLASLVLALGATLSAQTLPSPAPPGPPLLLDPADETVSEPAPARPADDDEPWSLAREAGLPSWLDLSFEHRARYEWLDREFRVGNLRGKNFFFALRTLVKAEARQGPWRLGAELADSRVYDDPDNGFIATSIVNTVEPLQAYAGYVFEDVGREGAEVDLRVGRQTMDVGSRRLVARNRFRNTINGFTGVNAVWTGDGEDRLQAFAVVPQARKPSTFGDLHDNQRELDDELERTRFFGVHGTTAVGERSTAEGYVFALDERDSGSVTTRDRDIWTVGGRVLTPPKAGETSFEWESAVQFGESRSGAAATNTTDLTHRAHFHHLSFGYRFEDETKSHLELLFDYASGDEDPTDSTNGRFDTLFGARRWEFGPTGLFGVFARSNLVSPGVRYTCRPDERTQVMVAARQGWLAEKKDAWTTSGLVDPAGDSGRDVGQLAEIRVRHDVAPGNWRLEWGYARFFAGSFVRNAPNNTGQDDADYVYAATTWRF